MSTASIVPRLTALNQKLMTISKLQKMEDETNAHDVISSHKPCRCTHHTFQLKRHSCIQDYIPCIEKRKKGTPCSVETCVRKKICLCKICKLKNVSQNQRSSTSLNKMNNFNKENTGKSSETLEDINSKSTEERELHMVEEEIIHVFEDPNNSIKNHEENEVNQVGPSNLTNHAHKENDIESIPTKEKSTNDLIQSKKDDVPVKDNKSFERLQKDLSNERKRTKELEEKLKNLTCSIKCLKEDGEQRAACLRNALEKAEEQAKLAETSKTLAMDLAKQSKEQTDIVKSTKDQMINEITSLQKQIADITCKNTALTCECEDLKCKLKIASENEAKKCAEVTDEVNRIKCAIKEKEKALTTEKHEMKQMISELRNIMKIQKIRISELTDLCNKQQTAVQEREKEFSLKDMELNEAQRVLKLTNAKHETLKEENDELRSDLVETTKSCDCYQQELKRFKENHLCELKIKQKIIEDQDAAIRRQKKLLQDSETMVQETAREFDELKEELHYEKETNNSLQIALEKTEAELKKSYLIPCKNCENLESEMQFLTQEKQKAVSAAKFAVQKLCYSTKEFQRQVACERRQYRFVTLVLQKKEEEIECLKREILHKSKPLYRMKGYVL